MAKYDKFGISKEGEPNKLRSIIGGIMHIGSLGGAGDFRQMGDDLYRAMKTGKSQGGWNVTGGGKGDGKDEGKDDGENDGVKKVRPTFTDIDYTMKGAIRKKPIYTGKKPENEPGHTMKAGGLVRGAGKAERGRGRGKMV